MVWEVQTHGFRSCMCISTLLLKCSVLSAILVTGGANYLASAQATQSHALADAGTASPGEPTKTVPVSGALNPLPSPTRTNAEQDYRIGAGDVLDISVWKERDASVPSIVVRPDGKITLPLAKDIEVAGLTPGEAEKVITTKLSSFISDANVTVIVTAGNSKKIYVIGAVKREGPLAYTYRMTIMQALTEAGGLTDYAKRKKIYVLRAENGKETRIPFDYDAVLKGRDMEHVWLLPSDTLVVPH